MVGLAAAEAADDAALDAPKPKPVPMAPAAAEAAELAALPVPASCGEMRPLGP